MLQSSGTVRKLYHPLSKVLYIDFEGSLSRGIREIGYVVTKDEKIYSSKEQTGSNILESLQKLQSDNYSYIVAHNSHIEKNLIKKYFPYDLDKKTGAIRKHKWIDTLNVYRALYPGLNRYDLKTLMKIFVEEKMIRQEAEKRCSSNKRDFHHSLFDALCVYFLIKRIEKKINLKQFQSSG